MEKKQKLVDVWIASDGKEFFTQFKCEEHERTLEEEKALTEIQEMNARILAEHKAKVDAIVKFWEENPKEKTKVVEQHKQAILNSAINGVLWGWWKDWDFKKGCPIPFPKIVKISELEPHENTMAHVIQRFNVFESVSEARKNGWNKPIVTGDFWFKKKTLNIIIED